MIMRHIVFSAALMGCLAACGGGGGGSPELPGSPAPSDAQSPGGIWFGTDSAGESVVFYIAETGELRTTMHPEATIFVSFGGGSVNVTSTNVVAGSFELRGALSPSTFQRGEDLGCSIAGSVQERQTLSVDVACSDSSGVVYDEALTLMYDPNVYERDSSLDALVGNYTLEFQPATNSLTVVADGTLFGMFHNSARCMINGNASVIDANYTFLKITWTMTACTDLVGVYEGAVMSGFAMVNPAPTGDPDSYYFLLTGQAQDGLFSVSVLYEPT